jgi:murein L,D-transpeptidase YcbB/YkuD
MVSCGWRERARQRKQVDAHLQGALNHQKDLPFDSTLLYNFCRDYPLLDKYSENVKEVYRKHNFTHIWYDEQGIVEFGNTLYSKVKGLETEGLNTRFPYLDKLDGVFENDKENTLSSTEAEFMLTNLYLFYSDKVVKGLDDTISTALGWLLPRKQLAYLALLDSMMSGKQLLDRDDSLLFNQYYLLRDALKQYREIEKKGGWNPVIPDPKMKTIKPGDTGKTILQIRERLFITGDLKTNNLSNRYDTELAEGVKAFLKRYGKNPSDKILPEHIKAMNIPVEDLIMKIIVNMERCRWIDPGFLRGDEFIVVNIPAFRLTYVKNGKVELISPVIVGKNVTKTVIFSGKMSHIVFSPYWNIPTSIIRKEIQPGMARDKNYLEKHNMEWNDGQVRQKPGKNNSLGLVKFIFPNSNDIYMHDTPAKSLFERESRAFSHGCIRVGKPRDLAIAILQDDPYWTVKMIDAAMNAGQERSYPLKKKIPVYIGYLTTWIDNQGVINFYDDIYQRDARLSELLIGKE